MDPEIHEAAEQAYQIPEWLVIAQPIATTLGVLIALAVALWNVAKNREERKDRGKQLAALERAEEDRVGRPGPQGRSDLGPGVGVRPGHVDRQGLEPL